MPPRSDESLESHEHLTVADDGTTNQKNEDLLHLLLKRFHEASDSLFDIERELAEVFLESVQPMKSIYERTHRHTAFRSAICSIFADPDDIDLIKYERDHEDL
jgi:hypothetical protein